MGGCRVSAQVVHEGVERGKEEGEEEVTTWTDLKLATKLSLCGGRTLMSVREPALLPSERFSSVVSMSVQFSPLKPHSPG